MTMRDRISGKLNQAFSPQALEVIDESELHHGHSGWREGGETHFRVKLVSESFSNKSRLQCHRMVNEALAEELDDGVHALAIEARAPER